MPPDPKGAAVQEQAPSRTGEVVTHLMVLAIGLVLGLLIFGRSGPSYAEVRDGQAAAVRYFVPGQGECRAAVVRGRRHAEKCEASP